MALVEGGADHGCTTDTSSGLADVGLGAEVAVVARLSIQHGRVGTDPRHRIAEADNVTLVEGGADHRIRSGADAGFTGVDPRAQVSVVAGCVVGLLWIRADPGLRITSTYVVALVEGSADHWVAAGTDASQAGVALRAEVTIVARCSVGSRRVRAVTGDRIAYSRDMTLIDGCADE
jgi:hypothetical protein